MRWWALAIAVGVLVSPVGARAMGNMNPAGEYLPFGVNLGGAWDEDGNRGFVLGGEISYVIMDRDWVWLGPAVDLAWDFGRDALRHRAAFELGQHVLGAELGYVGEWTQEEYRPGLGGRVVLTTSVVSAYVGLAGVFGDAGPSRLLELGVLVKLPLGLD